MQDWQLLQDYAKHGSEAAFARLVERHAGLVYSTCLREVREPALAEDVTQVVFLLLARKASSMREGTVLAGWLFNTARFAAKNALKQQNRRRLAEEKAAAEIMTNLSPTDAESEAVWQEIEPLLHGGLAALPQRDRDAVLLRFFEGRSLKETGETLGISEDAARMRVARAVDKLRRYFARHGFAVPAAALIALLGTHAVHAAPAACVTQAAGLGGGAAQGLVSAKTAALCSNAQRAMLVAKVKLAAMVAVGVALAGTAGITVFNAASSAQPPAVQSVVLAPRTRAPRPAAATSQALAPTPQPRTAAVATKIPSPPFAQRPKARPLAPVENPRPAARRHPRLALAPSRKPSVPVRQRPPVEEVARKKAAPIARAAPLPTPRVAGAPRETGKPQAAVTPPNPVSPTSGVEGAPSATPATVATASDKPPADQAVPAATKTWRKRKKNKPLRPVHGRVTEVNESASIIVIHTPRGGLKTLEIPSAASIAVDDRPAVLGDIRPGMSVVVQSGDGQTVSTMTARAKRPKALRPDPFTKSLRRLLKQKKEVAPVHP